jgi:hypothetical protein
MNDIFAMGACRIQQAIQTLGYPISECWYYTHTLSQAIQACKYFRGELNYPDSIYDLVKIQGNINYPAHPKIESLIDSFNKAKIVFLEIQTNKNYEYNGFFLNQECKEAREVDGIKLHQDSKEDLINKMSIVEELLYHCPVVFVPHVFCDNWLKIMPGLAVRKYIEEAVIEFCSDKPSRLMFRPSTLINEYGDKMMLTTMDRNVDTNHYSDFGRNLVAQEFKQIIERTIGSL